MAFEAGRKAVIRSAGIGCCIPRGRYFFAFVDVVPPAGARMKSRACAMASRDIARLFYFTRA